MLARAYFILNPANPNQRTFPIVQQYPQDQSSPSHNISYATNSCGRFSCQKRNSITCIYRISPMLRMVMAMCFTVQSNGRRIPLIQLRYYLSIKRTAIMDSQASSQEKTSLAYHRAIVLHFKIFK